MGKKPNIETKNEKFWNMKPLHSPIISALFLSRSTFNEFRHDTQEYNVGPNCEVYR